VCEGSLKRLRLERIDLYQLHAPDPSVPFEDSVGVLADLKREGKIAHVGLSNVNVELLTKARSIVEIVSVQNRYNLTDRTSESVVDECTRLGIAFIPWYPLATGTYSANDGLLARVAERHHATPNQIALAWLLARSPMMLPIPGTSSIAHLEENVGSGSIVLTEDDHVELDSLRS
ncbi:MAG: aldo/keto reductase, partial [Polyangiaceae bacterium]|nr:aldo/keto reductase [Polyangiaceae bacterium]